MSFPAIFHVIGFLLGIVGALMAACGLLSAAYGEPEAMRALLLSGGTTLLVALVMWLPTRKRADFSWRDGICMVTFGWIFAGLAGALPFYWIGIVPDYISAFFEAMSGLTTTGATVLANLEQCPRGLLLWRALMQALGGGGVLLVVVAFLPFSGASGLQLYRAEVTGPLKDRVEPRVTSMAQRIWICYLLLTVLLFGALRVAGMSWFDSVCHSLSTISTGGFSTRSGSIAAFDSFSIEIIIGIFMILSGINFAYYVNAMHGDFKTLFTSGQTRVYLLLLAGSILLCAAGLLFWHGGEFPVRLREAFFTCSSVMTSTGFSTSDFAAWPSGLQAWLVLLMCTGACAGSTAGGIKIIRLRVLLAAWRRSFHEFLQPRAVLPLRLDGKPLSEDVVSGIIVFITVYFVLALLGILAMFFFVPGDGTAVSAVFSCLGNTGPGFASVGPLGTYAHIPSGGKLILSFLMLAGRLELYTVLTVLVPAFWRR